MTIPILRLSNILLSSLQGDLTDNDVLNFQKDILKKVKETSSAGVIIDIMGLDLVDSFMARVINETASMIRLLGAEIVVCGMQPSVALTLSEMGRDLVEIETTLNLDFALEFLNKRLNTNVEYKDTLMMKEESEPPNSTATTE
jgi:rsbT antagonist protein RsbS